MNLTESAIRRHMRNLKYIAQLLGKPLTGTGSLNDGDGLCLDVLPSGIKTWMYRYRVNKGTRRQVVLGQYPQMSLRAARAKRDAIAATV